MKRMFVCLFLMFLLGGITIYGLNKSSFFYINKSSKNNINFTTNSSKSNENLEKNNNFVIEESKEEGELNDDELEKQNTSQIYFKNIEEAYKLLGINEVEEIKEYSSNYIKTILKFTDINECLVESINIEGQKIIFNIVVKDDRFSVIKDRETNDITIQVKEGE
jgi:hypothetical protein